MAGEISRIGARVALDYLTGRSVGSGADFATWTANRSTYLALCSTAPTDSALGTELSTSGSAYARQAVTWSQPTAADPASTQNSADVVFGAFTSDPPNVTHCMLMDASSGGTATNMLMWWALDFAKDAATGEQIKFTSGNLVMTLT